ncbi:cell division protein SepF [Brevibacillus sp. NPDC058079]|uniref:cell division protein SepF n=1 Tax=Brevibacillus sp. NPDC058079 TaxID=3346330 RepID=UPI0036EE9B9F
MGIANKIMDYLGLGDEYESDQELIEEKPKQVSKHRIVETRNVIPFPQEATWKKTTCIRLVEPRNFNDSQDIADYLCRNQACILNIRMLDPHNSKRILDFLTGVVYALEGDIQRIGDDTYICVPESINIDSLITTSFI